MFIEARNRMSLSRTFGLLTIHAIYAAAAVSAMVMFSLGGPVEAATWDLADDFSLTSNPNGAWTYQLEVTPGDDDMAYTPLDTNTLNANQIWGTAFAAPPTMWSEASGYWGIGRNDSGVTQTSPNVIWNPGEVLFHPKVGFDGSGGRFVITWAAPADMTIDVAWAYAKRSTDGADGVGLGVLLESGGTNIVLRGFADPDGAAGLFDDLAVLAGDKLHFRFDNWADGGGDITWADITVTQFVAIPAPAALPAGLMLLGAAALRRRGMK